MGLEDKIDWERIPTIGTTPEWWMLGRIVVLVPVSVAPAPRGSARASGEDQA
jgi:hypothetical protein